MTMKFRLGKLVATPGAIDAIGHEALLSCVQRHASGDWGEVDAQDWKENELSLRQGFRLLSAWRKSNIAASNRKILKRSQC